ncbi:MAG: hypothetical protein FWE44_04590 [Defluviitaleaceae bacterium]|nr:hypothetical protein [Defluviitaleaceae bacterium]
MLKIKKLWSIMGRAGSADDELCGKRGVKLYGSLLTIGSKHEGDYK